MKPNSASGVRAEGEMMLGYLVASQRSRVR